jgi:hypothetical protein
MENTKTEQGNGISQRKMSVKFHYNSATSNFTGKHSLVLKMWQEDRHGKCNMNISARFVTANIPNGYVLLK